MSSHGDIVVANPNTNPEIVQAATSLAEAARLARYHAPILTTAAQQHRIEWLLPRRVADPVLRELRRRPVPRGVPAASVELTAPWAEVLRVAATRLGLSVDVRTRLAHTQRRRFDEQMARRLRTTDRGLLAVVGSASVTVRQATALGIPSIVDSPLSHMGWVRELMREEARLVPEYLGTLQGHNFADEIIAAHDETYALAARVLVLSAQAQATLADRGTDPDRMILTPLGVDLNLFRPAPRADDGVFRIVFVGQITQRKGISYLVEAFKQAAIPRSELVFVGEVIGTPEPWISVPGVRYVPALPREDLPSVYAAADVYVLPSLAEGFPLTTMEALASGVPVIVTDHSSGPDILTEGHDGFVVPIRDPAAIADRLVALHQDPDRRARMGVAARETAERYPWDRYGAQVLDVVAGLS